MTVAVSVAGRGHVASGGQARRIARMVTARTAVVVGVLFLWWFLAAVHAFSVGILASPRSVLRAANHDWTKVVGQLDVTLGEIGVALAIAWAGGLVLGALLGSVRFLSPALGLARTVYAVPIILVYPILTVWLGYGSTSKVVFGVLAGLIPMVLMSASAVATADRGTILLFQSIGASRATTIGKGIIPASLPGIIGAVRLSGSITVVSVVVGEMLVATKGLGYWISNSASQFDTPAVYLGICFVIALGAALHTVVDLADMALARYTGRISG